MLPFETSPNALAILLRLFPNTGSFFQNQTSRYKLPRPAAARSEQCMRRIAHARGAGLISGLSISAADKIKEPRAGSAVRRRGHQIVCFSRARKMRGNPREISAQKKPLRTFRKSFFGAFGGVFAAADSYSANAMSGSSASVILYWSPGRMTSGLSRAYTCK